jgi:hypothetical protein
MEAFTQKALRAFKLRYNLFLTYLRYLMNSQESQIPCIIDRGVIFNKKDMMRVLQGLDQVEYTEIIDEKPAVKREGFIVEIFEDPNEATIFLNRRIYINVNSFEYIKISYDPTEEALKEKRTYSIELFMPNRKVVLRPLTDPIDNPNTLIAEVEERRRNNLVGWEEVVAEVDED